MKNSTRIYWMDGLKGLSCLLIFAHHFFLIFYPAIHYGAYVPSHLRGFDTALSQSPLSVVINGNFLVALFCVISGAVISFQVMTLTDRTKLADIAIKRYFRLMLPLLPVGLIVYGMLRLGLFSNLETAAFTGSPWAAQFYLQPVTFQQALDSIFFDIWFVGDDKLSTAFWMLSQLFYGTFVSIILSVISWKYKRHTWVIYLLLAMALFNCGYLYSAFVLGTLLAWLHINQPKCFRRLLGWVCLVLGIFLGGYPSGVVPTNIYRFLQKLGCIDAHIWGAFFTLYGIWSIDILQKVLSCSPLQALGRISYSVYLIHIPLLFCVSTSVFLFAVKYMRYFYSVLISLLVSATLLIILSTVYQKLADKGCTAVQSRILSLFTKEDPSP